MTADIGSLPIKSGGLEYMQRDKFDLPVKVSTFQKYIFSTCFHFLRGTLSRGSGPIFAVNADSDLWNCYE